MLELFDFSEHCDVQTFNSVTDCDRMADTLKFGPEWYVN